MWVFKFSVNFNIQDFVDVKYQVSFQFELWLIWESWLSVEWEIASNQYQLRE